MINQPQTYYSTYQLKIPVDIEKIIEISDPVYTFCEVLEHIDLYKYLVRKENKTGRPRYDLITLLKVILFAFMEYGYVSTRMIEKLCKTDIRFMCLLNRNDALSHMTIDNFMKNYLCNTIEEIFAEINFYIFAKENVDLDHVYVDGTKVRANANMYSWVWKKSSVKNRDKTFLKVSELLEQMNETIAGFGVKFETRTEYAIEYLEDILQKYVKLTGIIPNDIVRVRGHHKTPEQRYYDLLVEYVEKLKEYAEHIRICTDVRNSFSKTDNDATFFRMKKDYMGNDQLLPGFNVQFEICDEYMAVFNVLQYASDMDCFVLLMNTYRKLYGLYPTYPSADAGYGSYNNYLFCEEHGMEKYMKFTMYEKECKDDDYHNDPCRAVNSLIDESGHPVCPGGKRFHYLKTAPVKGNKYGRTEEYYQCEDCSGCTHREKCHRSQGNRVVRINEELTVFHKEVKLRSRSTSADEPKHTSRRSVWIDQVESLLYKSSPTRCKRCIFRDWNDFYRF